MKRIEENTFLIQKLSYGGIKIDTARAKYNPENFKYEILETRSK